MYHTWKRLFFLIVLCCPVAVAAEDGNLDPGMAEPRDATAFRDCVLKAKDWKTDCSRMPLFPTENPYSSDDSYFRLRNWFRREEESGVRRQPKRFVSSTFQRKRYKVVTLRLWTLLK